ncbi:hypothetical protein HPB51_020277 [Rhipicephalus microplus]|uniref:Uncharacterized protein n=1 Tax=Rhipicephalus microplus TaxID=6941 RepID=A0A9J6DC70_RHIMP|nr:hypothetical protein HPB51_020277 [Rhipicephalus microplus]
MGRAGRNSGLSAARRVPKVVHREPPAEVSAKQYVYSRLEVLKLCVSLSKVSTDDAYFLKNAHAKLVDASAHQRRIDELFKQYEQLKEQEAKILADLQVRVELAECQRSFIESLPPKSQPTGTATQGIAQRCFLKKAHAKLVDASEHQRRIDELCKQYEPLKERDVKILANLDVQVQLSECRRSFNESLPLKSQPSGWDTQGSFLAAGDKSRRQ